MGYYAFFSLWSLYSLYTFFPGAIMQSLLCGNTELYNLILVHYTQSPLVHELTHEYTYNSYNLSWYDSYDYSLQHRLCPWIRSRLIDRSQVLCYTALSPILVHKLQTKRRTCKQRSDDVAVVVWRWWWWWR